MHPDTDRIVDGLLRWWQRRFPMAHGQRNASIFKLAAALNNYGIPCTRALEECLRYADPTAHDPFTDREITRTVESAYRSTEHAIKEWRGGHDGHTTRPAYTPRLTPAQAKAVEDRLAEEFRARFAWKPWDMEPQQPHAEGVAMAAPAPTAAPPPPTAAPPTPPAVPPPTPQPDELGAWLKRGTAEERAALVRGLFTTARPRIGQHEFNDLLAQAAGTTPRAVVGSVLDALAAGVVKVHPSSLLHLP